MNSPVERAQHTPLRPAVFFDRDGTLTRESDWVRRPSDLELLPRAAEAVRFVNEAGIAAVLVTNQSAIARGLISESDLERIHAHLAREFEKSGARIDAIFHCPHHPTEGVSDLTCVCECRKPRTALLARAARELGLDLQRSWIIGDAERDLLAGQALGVRGVLVATGKGDSEHARLARLGRAPEHYASDVLAAARVIRAALKADSAPSGPTSAA